MKIRSSFTHPYLATLVLLGGCASDPTDTENPTNPNPGQWPFSPTECRWDNPNPTRLYGVRINDFTREPWVTIETEVEVSPPTPITGYELHALVDWLGRGRWDPYGYTLREDYRDGQEVLLEWLTCQQGRFNRRYPFKIHIHAPPGQGVRLAIWGSISARIGDPIEVGRRIEEGQNCADIDSRLSALAFRCAHRKCGMRTTEILTNGGQRYCALELYSAP